MVLYKYRTLDNFMRFLDILMNGRLYGAHLNQLNDPMEGTYRYNPDIPKESREQLLQDISNTLVCSLSESSDIGLMWVHYANDGKGCCIEVEVTSKSWKKKKVEYIEKLKENAFSSGDKVESILSKKNSCWKYEKEVRYIRNVEKKESHYLEVQVTKVIFGYGVSDADFKMYKKLIDGINNVKKKKKKKIICEKIRRNDVTWN